MRQQHSKPELLAPAGTMDALRAAVHFGADAVYGGMQRFGLRAFAGNFDGAALAEAVAYCHRHGRRFYLTMNVFPYDDELGDFVAAARQARDTGVDAVIVSDLGAICALREALPELPVHVSTQASTVNSAAIRHYGALGCSRVILARELSLDRISALREHVPPEMELETFVHGASCMAWSGRCLLSAQLAGRILYSLFTLGINEVDNRLRRAQIHPAVQESPFGELARASLSGTEEEKLAQERLQQHGRAMALEFRRVLAGIAARAAADGAQRNIQQFPLRALQFSENKLSVRLPTHCAAAVREEEPVRNRNGLRAGHPHNADRGHLLPGGNGSDCIHHATPFFETSSRFKNPPVWREGSNADEKRMLRPVFPTWLLWPIFRPFSPRQNSSGKADCRKNEYSQQ